MLVGLDICIDFVGVTVLDDLDGVFVISLVGWCLVGNLLDLFCQYICLLEQLVQRLLHGGNDERI